MVGAVAIAADVVTKWLAAEFLQGGESVRLPTGAVYLSYTTNPGAAFNLASDYTWLLALIALAVIVFLLVIARKIRTKTWAVTLGLLLGGATGNFIDRVFREPGFLHGEVVDFISLFAPNGQVWPIFNLADSSLVVGVTLVVLLEFTGRSFSPLPDEEDSRSDGKTTSNSVDKQSKEAE